MTIRALVDGTVMLKNNSNYGFDVSDSILRFLEAGDLVFVTRVFVQPRGERQDGPMWIVAAGASHQSGGDTAWGNLLNTGEGAWFYSGCVVSAMRNGQSLVLPPRGHVTDPVAKAYAKKRFAELGWKPPT